MTEIAYRIEVRKMDLTQAEREAIQAVIEQQIMAFQKDDAIAAFAFASPDIQNQFGDPETFMSMVKTGYYSLYRPRSVVFSAVTLIQDSPAQKVILMDAEGDLVMAIYQMQQQLNGEWRIHGCFLTSVEEQLM
ncbi:DUF4864 domain-containing protein [Oculatella sp. LEGE 06141]|uniref:DUF4864 domain-containing protein n=1 Tax=Oculatella sp. LEGE 06141 TaxID=1828648 RepID=UPI0030D87794